MRTLLVDDHGLFREGLKFLLANLDSQMSFDEAGSCKEAIALSEQPIDLVLLDLHMPGTSGFDVLGTIRTAFDASVLVVLSSEDDPRVIRRAIEMGASGFIPKACTSQLMIAALRLVLAGGTYLPPHVLRNVEAIVPTPMPVTSQDTLPRSADGMSGRQREVLMKAVQGKANKVIARELRLSEGTVKAHLSAAFRALGVQNRTEAVYIAAKAGLTHVPAPPAAPH